jgi:integrase
MATPKRGTAGSIREKGPGRWLVRLQLGVDAKGKRIREHRIVRGTRKDAQRHLTDLLKRKDDGLPTVLSRQTLGQWVEEWLAHWTGSKGAATRSYYEQVLRRLFEFDPTLGGIRLPALTPERVQHLLNDLKRTKARVRAPGKNKWTVTDAALSARTVRMYHGALRAVLNDALRLGKIQRNVASLVRPPSLPHSERSFLTAEQAEHFLTVAADNRFHAYFATLLLAGLRPSEALALKWSDIAGRDLRIQRSLIWVSREKGGPVFANTKTGRARTVAIGERLIRILQRQRVRQAEWRLKMGASYVDEDLIFASETGGPLQLRNIIGRHFKPLLRRAKLPNIRLYDLRHTHATLLYAAGEQLKVVQERLGHASITLTLDTYVHVAPGMQERAAERLDALLDTARAAGEAR